MSEITTDITTEISTGINTAITTGRTTKSSVTPEKSLSDSIKGTVFNVRLLIECNTYYN